MALHRVRVQWGYLMFYAPYPWQHQEYCWDGAATVRGGRIVRSWSMHVRASYGDQRIELAPLTEPRWYWQQDTVQNRMGGVVLEIEGDLNSELEVVTRSASMRFTLRRLRRERIITTHVGARYSNVNLSAFFDDDDPNLDDARDLRQLTAADGRWRDLAEAQSFRGPVHRCFRIDWAWALPGRGVEVNVPRSFRQQESMRDGRAAIAAVIRWAATVVIPGETPDRVDARAGRWNPGTDTIIEDLPYAIELNGSEVARGRQTFWHIWLPTIEELEVVLPAQLLAPGVNRLRITNLDSQHQLMIARVLFEERRLDDLELAVCPSWVVRGREFEIELLCRSEQRQVQAHLPEGVTLLDRIPEPLSAGRHRLRLQAEEPLADAVIAFSSAAARCERRIEQVVASREEPHPMLVGFEDGLMPKELPGYQEEVLQHFSDNQLGNTLVFRGCHVHQRALDIAACCKRLGLSMQAASQFDPHWAKEQSDLLGPLFSGYYWSEYDGFLWGYAVMPERLPRNVSAERRTMRTAYENYMAYQRGLVAWVHEADPQMPNLALISTSGIHAYACEAGMAWTLSQFNKSHNTLLVADARGAARAYRRLWGTYQAEGGHVVPEGRYHLRMWRLSLQLAYVAGAAQVNDEENLYRTQHCRVYGRGDYIPRMRQQILKEFYRYAGSHPRRGTLSVRQACLIGRYACDVADGISRTDPLGQDNAPAVVWRNFGAMGPEWRPLTPEYGLRYLDLFFPGVWLPNLEQTPEILRRWYCGTPLGEIELAPIDAPGEILAQYRLLLLLGWNTMDEAQYGSLRGYVEQGGRLFMSVPHATRNESRRFLIEDLEPLNLVRNGDFRDLFGVVVKGRGPRLDRIQGDPSVAGNPVGGFFQVSTTSTPPPVVPQHPLVDLAEVELAGAEVLATDVASGAPVLVRHRVGAGEAYLLCTHEYPGNSRLVPFVKPLVRALAQTTPWPVELEDVSGDVYYTVREEAAGTQTIHLLNTDWTAADNEKACRLRLGDAWVELAVREGRISAVTRCGALALLVEDHNLHLEEVEVADGSVTAVLHGCGAGEVKLHPLQGRIASVAVGGADAAVAAKEGWQSVGVSFGSRSVTELTVEVAP